MTDNLGKRIIVIGSPGAGKSRLSTELSLITGLELHHRDRIHWLPGWKAISHEEFVEKQSLLVSGESWVIDGNYQSTLHLRAAAADTIIFLDFNRLLCVYRAIKRAVTSKGSRLDITEGCSERINVEFLKWVWNYRKRDRAETMKILAGCGEKKIIVLKGPKEARKFLKSL